jgi:hypothetical protein
MGFFLLLSSVFCILMCTLYIYYTHPHIVRQVKYLIRHEGMKKRTLLDAGPAAASASPAGTPP